MLIVYLCVYLLISYVYLYFVMLFSICKQLFVIGRGGGRVERRCWVNFQCRDVLLFWLIVGQGPIALAVGAGGGLFGHFFLSSILSSLFFLPLFGRRPDID